MDISHLNSLMKAEARSLGLCDEWYGEWADDSNVDALLDKYVRGIDFCIEHDFPDNYILKHYAADNIHSHGIYIDEDASCSSAKGTIILNGGCTGTLVVKGMSMCSLYVRHSSNVKIRIEDIARVSIETYDNCCVEIDNQSNNNCYVYHHGGTVRYTQGVLVRERVNK